MNKVIKMLIKENIHNNNLKYFQTPSGDKYTITTKQGIEILVVNNSWAKNYYNITINHHPILTVHWDQTNSKPLTSDQKDMLDIINDCKEKINLQETAQTMNSTELELANFLHQSLCPVNH